MWRHLCRLCGTTCAHRQSWTALMATYLYHSLEQSEQSNRCAQQSGFASISWLAIRYQLVLRIELFHLICARIRVKNIPITRMQFIWHSIRQLIAKLFFKVNSDLNPIQQSMDDRSEKCDQWPRLQCHERGIEPLLWTPFGTKNLETFSWKQIGVRKLDEGVNEFLVQTEVSWL